jgi:hypothetical protein
VNATVAERRPHYLQLVADHGRLVDPAFVPREPIWVARGQVGAGQLPHVRRSLAAGRPEATSSDGPRPPAGPPEATARPAGEASPASPAPRRQGASGQEPARRPVAAKPVPRGRAPLRLTRRGRLAITSTVVVLIAAGSMAASMAVAGTARAGAHPGVSPHPAVPVQAAVQVAGAVRGVRAALAGGVPVTRRRGGRASLASDASASMLVFSLQPARVCSTVDHNI